MPAPLTDKQREVLQLIIDYRNEWGFSPTLREINQHFGWSSVNAAARHLRVLASKGWVTWLPGASRTIVVLEEPEEPSHAT